MKSNKNNKVSVPLKIHLFITPFKNGEKYSLKTSKNLCFLKEQILPNFTKSQAAYVL